GHDRRRNRTHRRADPRARRHAFAGGGGARHGFRRQDRAQGDGTARRLGAGRRLDGRGAGKRARDRGLSRPMSNRPPPVPMATPNDGPREMLRVENLNQYYGGSHILRNVNLAVREGACTVLLGRNGVGKSTLLKTIMGLVAARSGMVKFDGADLSAL